jgi:hypothetical protein
MYTFLTFQPELENAGKRLCMLFFPGLFLTVLTLPFLQRTLLRNKEIKQLFLRESCALMVKVTPKLLYLRQLGFFLLAQHVSLMCLLSLQIRVLFFSMIGLCIAAAAAEIVVGDNLGGFRDRRGSKVGLCVSLLSAFNPTH